MQITQQVSGQLARALVEDALSELLSDTLRFLARDIQEYVAKKANLKGKLPITLGVAKGYGPGGIYDQVTMITVSDLNNPEYRRNLDSFMTTLKKEFPDAVILGGNVGDLHAEDYLKDNVGKHFDIDKPVLGGISNDIQGICGKCQQVGGGERFKKGKGVKFKIPGLSNRYLYIAGEIISWFI